MTMKKRKFATTLLTTALLTCGFTLKTNAHQTPDEPNTPTETETHHKETTPYLVEENKHKHRIKTGHPSQRKAHHTPVRRPQDTHPLPEEEPHTTEETPPPAEDILTQVLNGTYQFNGNEIIYTESAIIYITYPSAEELKSVYVPGFGWVTPNNEPSIQIQALDMVENGNKVGSM